MQSFATTFARNMLGGIALALMGSISAAGAAEVNLYTTREPGLIQPLLDAFTKSSGVKVNTIFLKAGLAERVATEGDKSPADVLMTVDIGNLIDLADRGLTQPVQSEPLSATIPAQLRDSKGNWFALSLRARTVYAAKDLPFNSFNYEDLADPKWKGKVCIRSGQHPYNVGLIAAYIAHYGEAQAETWLKGLKANLARKAGGGDREVARDIKGGLCEIGVANSYYVGLMRSGKGGPDQEAWAKAIKMILPTFKNGGTHVNISGAAVAKYAPNKSDAVKLLEYLVSTDAQKIYAEGNFEYPVNAKAHVSPLIGEYGTLKPDTIDLAKIASFRKKASELAEKVGFDN